MTRTSLSLAFFDELASHRDADFQRDPVLGYEQAMRQAAIGRLIGGRTGLTLDAGCGNGRDADFLVPLSHAYVGADLSIGMLREAKRKIGAKKEVALVRSSITRLPFLSDTFDTVVCSEVLEHVPDYLGAFKELARVMRKSGQLVVSTPNKLSLYYPQKVLVERRKPSHRFDDWKTIWNLRERGKLSGLRLADFQGACFLPGLICYRPWPKLVCSRFLPLLRVLEVRALSRSFLRSLAYVIVARFERSA
jgi:SAM-dependent methyltransferase